MKMSLWGAAEAVTVVGVPAIVHAASEDGERVKGRSGTFQAMAMSSPSVVGSSLCRPGAPEAVPAAKQSVFTGHHG
jgi:hypothetical protein